MQAVQVTEWAEGPKPTSIPKPEIPEDDSLVQVRVGAAAIHQLVRTRASGKHYSGGSALPHTLGTDGTGVKVATGEQVYFNILGGNGPATGTFAEYVNVGQADVCPLPNGVDPVMAAALTNPVMSSWMALRHRAGLGEGWRCLIIGVTAASGKLAIQVARELGADKVYGAARNEAAMKELGLDGHAVLQGEPEKTDFSAVASATVVLDYLWGPWPAVYLTNSFAAGAKGPLQWISIGNMAGEATPLPATSLRNRNVTFRGAGPGAWRPSALAEETPGMLKALAGMKDDGSGKVVKVMKFSEAKEAWNVKGPRVVLTPDS